MAAYEQKRSVLDRRGCGSSWSGPRTAGASSTSGRDAAPVRAHSGQMKPPSWRESADAASARAAQCRQRSAALTDRRKVDAADAQRAQQALERALSRAAMAQSRLLSGREYRYLLATHAHSALAAEWLLEPVAAADLRSRAGDLDAASVYPTYVELGGSCTEFELD